MNREPLHIYCNRRLTALLLLPFTFMLAIGVHFAMDGHGWPLVLGIFFLLLTGLLTEVLVRLLVSFRPMISIDREGIHDRLVGYGTIPWDEIAGIEVIHSDGKAVALSIRVDHLPTYTSRLPLWRRGINGFRSKSLTLNFVLLDTSVETAMFAVQRCKPAHVHALPARCPDCGYDLRGTPHLCPECGKKIVGL